MLSRRFWRKPWLWEVHVDTIHVDLGSVFPRAPRIWQLAPVFRVFSRSSRIFRVKLHSCKSALHFHVHRMCQVTEAIARYSHVFNVKLQTGKYGHAFYVLLESGSSRVSLWRLFGRNPNIFHVIVLAIQTLFPRAHLTCSTFLWQSSWIVSLKNFQHCGDGLGSRGRFAYAVTSTRTYFIRQ